MIGGWVEELEDLEYSVGTTCPGSACGHGLEARQEPSGAGWGAKPLSLLLSPVKPCEAKIPSECPWKAEPQVPLPGAELRAAWKTGTTEGFSVVSVV